MMEHVLWVEYLNSRILHSKIPISRSSNNVLPPKRLELEALLDGIRLEAGTLRLIGFGFFTSKMSYTEFASLIVLYFELFTRVWSFHEHGQS